MAGAFENGEKAREAARGEEKEETALECRWLYSDICQQFC
nr:hypothetical protein [Sinorhizobium medicae]